MEEEDCSAPCNDEQLLFWTKYELLFRFLYQFAYDLRYFSEKKEHLRAYGLDVGHFYV